MTQPTIGIEIELPWPTMLARVDNEAADILASSRGFWGLPKEEQERVQGGFDLLDEQYKEKINGIFGDEIARGNDGYAEFALRPQREYERLTEIVANLYTEEILSADEAYPLHVTLGNVPPTQSAWLILTAMELSGGTTSERISQKHTWSRKGLAGILARKPHELALGSTVGFEMRSLVVASLERLDQSLRIAQTAGSILMGKVAGTRKDRDSWQSLYAHIIGSMAQVGIDAGYQWPNPQDDPVPWYAVAGALNDTEWQKSVENGILARLEV